MWRFVVVAAILACTVADDHILKLENDGTPLPDEPGAPSDTLFKGVHAAYYLWYGNPRTDNKYLHWNHEVLPHWTPRIRDRFPHGIAFSPPEELHSVYYPARGCYSSADKRLLGDHFQEMKLHGIDVAVLSWWGRPDQKGTHDTQGVSTDDRIPAVLDAAALAGVKIAFHLEPYEGRTAYSLKTDLTYIREHYGGHAALLKAFPKRRREASHPRPVPVYYVYDSYHVSVLEWQQVLGPEGRLTVRGSRDDGVFIGLWLDITHGRELFQSGFDGAYTYFASDGFSYGATTSHWKDMKAFCDTHDLYFVPSVGPGYDDTRIRPWNAGNKKSREGGDYYERMFEAAVSTYPSAVFVTSYNEWGEGTQIEPAVPHEVPVGSGLSEEVRSKLKINRVSDDYEPMGPTFYLDRTKYWSARLHQQGSAPQNTEL